MKLIMLVELVLRRELYALVLAITFGAGYSPIYADVPPLTESELQRVSTAVEGQDRFDEAFAALVEHVCTWPPAEDIQLEMLPLRRRVDWEGFKEEPSNLRGELVEIYGRCVLESPVDPSVAGDGIYELFVDTNQGTIIAYVCGSENISFNQRQVRVLGRLYTVKTMLSKDSVARSWPALVGVVLPQAAVGSDLPGHIILVLVMIGMGVWFFLRRSAKKGFQGDTTQALAALRQDADDEEGESPNLPQDPVEALKELTKERTASEDQDV